MAATADLSNPVMLPCKGSAVLVKWKVKVGTRVSHGNIVALYKTDGNDTIQKLKSNGVGMVKEIMVAEGEVVSPGQSILKLEELQTVVCTHSIVMKDMCAECGADLRQELGRPGDRKAPVKASVAMVHSVPELIVSEEQALELGRADEGRLLQSRKLVLLVDLDQTLIHTTNDNIPPNLKGAYHFQLPHGPTTLWYHTKFRPGTESFLQKVSSMYELHICTFGVRMYAHTIARFLDPEGKYFSHRILSRDECFSSNSKTANLKALFPCGDSMVCIIDDREDVWMFAPNLVHVKPYHFFQGTADINAPPGLAKNEEDSKTMAHKTVIHGEKSSASKQMADDKEMKTDSAEKVTAEIESAADNETKDILTEDKNARTEENGNADQEESVLEEKMEIDQPDIVTEMRSLQSDQEMCEKKAETENTESEDHSSSSTVKDGQSVNQKITSETVTQHSDDKNELDADHSESRSASDDNTAPDAKSGEDEEVIEGNKSTESENTERESETKHSNESVEASDSNVISDSSKMESTNVDKSDDSKSKNDNIEVDITTMSSDSEQKMDTKTDTTGDDDKEETVEWEDEDDYLYYLEDVLTRIHAAFFNMYDQIKDKSDRVPDLKNIIPYVKRKVLKGVNVVFSGVIPTNSPMEKHKAYVTAKSLGAIVQTAFAPSSGDANVDATTHVIAAKPGTAKVNIAMKHKRVHIVTPEWLWVCAERWERVDERLFPLKSAHAHARDSPDLSLRSGVKRKSEEVLQPSPAPVYDPVTGKRVHKSRKMNSNDIKVPKTGESSSEIVPAQRTSERKFSDSYNPLYSFSREDIDNMDKEVEEIFDESDDNSSSSSSSDDDEDLRKKVLSPKDSDSSSGDSLSGDFPRGWKTKQKKKIERLSKKTEDVDNDSQDERREAGDHMYEEEGDKKVRRIHITLGEDDSSANEGSENDFDSIGSVDEEMAAAVEKEFLSN